MKRVLTITTLTMCVGTIGSNSLALGPISPGVAEDLGAVVTTIMYAAASYGVGTAIGALLLSPLIDRIGVRRALVVALLGLTLAFALTAGSTGVTMLATAQGVAGLAAGLGLPAAYAFAMKIAKPGHESQNLGWVLTGWTLSLVIGVSVSALIADLLHWRWVYVGLTALALLTLLALMPMQSPGDAAEESKSVWPHQMIGVSGVLPLLFVCFANMAAFYGTYAYISDHIHRVLSRQLSATALITLSYGIGFGLAVAGDRIIDTVGSKQALPWFYLLLSMVYASLSVASSSYYLLVIASFFWGLANHFGLNLIVASLAAIDPARVGALLGLNSAVTYISASAGTLMFGYVYDQAGFVFVAAGSSVIVATAALAGFVRIERRATAPDTEAAE